MNGADDSAFAGVELGALRAAALERATALGCSHAEVRVERIRSQLVVLRDGRLQTAVDDTSSGMGLRVVRRGALGLRRHRRDDARRGRRAGRAGGGPGRRHRAALAVPVELAAEPAHGPLAWTSPFTVDPTTVALADKVGLLGDWSGRLLGAPGWTTCRPTCSPWWRTSTTADLAGTVTTQRRVRIHPVVEAVAVDAVGRLRVDAHPGPAGRAEAGST